MKSTKAATRALAGIAAVAMTVLIVTGIARLGNSYAERGAAAPTTSAQAGSGRPSEWKRA